MFRLIYKRFQTSNLFEKLLLIVGVAVGLIGFWFINTLYYESPGLSWQFLTAVFLWLLLIFIVILTDSNESIKEELSLIMREHIKETQLLKEELVLLRDEFKLLNAALIKSKKK